MKLAIVKLDSASVLLAPVHRFQLAFTLDFLRDPRNGNREGQSKECEKKNGDKHGKSLFRGLAGAAGSSHAIY